MANEQRMTRHEMETKLVAQAWQNEAFKQELVSNPTAVIEREFGCNVSESTNIQVLEETGNTIYFVIPKKPGTQELSEEQLEAVAGGDAGWELLVPDTVSLFPVKFGWNLDSFS